MSGILQIFYIFFSSLLMFFALPNEFNYFGSPFTGILALIPLYMVYSSLKNHRQAFGLFFLHGSLTHLFSSFWLAYFKNFALITLGASAFGTGLIEGAMGFIFYLPSMKDRNSLRHYSTQEGAIRNLVKILWFASTWTLYEWIKSIGFLGYPWATLSSCMYRLRILAQIADITGTYGISFITCFLTALISEGIILWYNIRKSQKPQNIIFSYACAACLWGALALVSFAYGLYQYLIPRTPVKYLNTVLVQQNADPWKMASDEESILLSQRITDEQIQKASEENTEIDLAVWSEGCLKYNFPGSLNYYKYSPDENPLIPYIQKKQIPFIFGAPYSEYIDGERENFNSAILFDEKGEFRGAYGKIHLVPMAESIPFSQIPAVKTFMKKVLKISAGWTPGNQYVYFKIKGRYPENRKRPQLKIIDLEQSYREQKTAESDRPYVTVSSPICYDDAFPDVIRPMSLNGTELFINITDDSWSTKNSAEYQHFVVSSYRAIESRTTFARSCNSGYSVILDPAGKILCDMPVFQEAGMYYKIPVYKRKLTIYTRLGNWLPFFLLIFSIIYGIHSFREFREPAVLSERKIRKSHKKHKKNEKKHKKDN